MNSHSLARTSPRSRLTLAERVLHQDWTCARASAAFAVSTKTTRKWVRRYLDGGELALRDRSSRPASSPSRTAPILEAQVIQLRRQRQSGTAIARQLRMPRSTVYRILRRAGLSRLKSLEPPQPTVRYEWRHAGELLHIDTKKLVRIARPGHRIHGDRRTTVRGIGWEAVHVCVDDATRLAYVEVLDDERGPSCTAFLRRAIEWYERQGIRVQRVMTDNGSAYKSPKSLFSQLCARRGIKHVRTRPYRPQTNGKAERFIQTMLREWAYAVAYDNSRRRAAALPSWLTYYNRRRPHGSLDGDSPFSNLQRRREQRA